MANFGSGATGALGGAASGAALGSFLPGLGTLAGGIGGGLLGGLSGLFGDPGSQKGQEMRFQRFSNPQQQAQNQLLQQALAGLGQGQNQFNFAPIAQQARTNFAQQTVPGIAERFSSLGSGGAQRSSAFGQALGSAGAGLEGNLAGMQQEYGLQQQNQQQQMLMNLLGIGLTPQYESAYQPRQPGIFESAAKAGAQSLPMLGLLKYQNYLQGLGK